MSTISLLTLNIEQRKHIEQVLPFLAERRPEVICLQEIFEDTFEMFKKALGYDGFYMPRVQYHEYPGDEGMAMLSRLPMRNMQVQDYDQFTGEIPELTHILKGRPRAALMSAVISKEGNDFTVATTHFTWSMAGAVTEEQRVNLAKMLELTDALGEVVLCGDFNTPRGSELYDELATRFTSHVHVEATTSLDENLHRAGRLDLVVDGLFTSPEYVVRNAALEFGLSDHAGISAEITK